jgi:tetratricopeptide (TPR) repeat protein
MISLKGLGNRIISEIKIARAFRQSDVVRQLSSILINFPVREYQLIGEYYEVWCDYRESKCRTEVLERVIEQSKTYKTKALFSLAAFEGRKGRIETSLRLYSESLKTAPTVSEQIELLRSVAVLKAGEGFHASSLKDLESLLPFIRCSEPLAYYDFLNSYAIELGEVGRIEEAQNVCRITLASPYAFAYPEWSETANEIALRGYKSRSSVSVTRNTPANIPTQVPPALDEETTTEDNVIKFPHPVDMEKLEQEDKERFSAEMKKALELSDNCTLHEFIEDIFMGGMTPDRFGKFLVKMIDFKNIKMLLDVIESMLHQTFLNTDKCKEAEGEWREGLLEKDS